MSSMHIACAADERYVAHSAAMLHSVISTSGPGVVAHYLHGPGLPEADAVKLERMFAEHSAEIVFHEITDPRLAGLPVQDLFGFAMWYRILLPELLPDVDRLLYLDVDTIALQSIAPLWQLELGDAYLAAVTNVCMGHHRHRPLELGIELVDYFNSGVLLLNLDAMRSDDFVTLLLGRLAVEGPALLWPDQDALNRAAAARWKPLHPRWNSMNSLLTVHDHAVELFGEQAVTEAITDPAIRHFEGPGTNKPWHLLHDRAGQRLYREHRRSTPWPQYRLAGATPRNRLKRLRMDARAHRAVRSRL
jgi:lipopolysaccharide biosynthesis glycosyltransferase